MGRVRTARYGASGIGTFFKTVRASGLEPAISASREDPYNGESTCNDTFGAHDSLFSVTHKSCSGHRLTHRFVYNPDKPNEWCELKNYPLSYFCSLLNFPAHLTIPDVPNTSSLAVQVLNATNPSKPSIDLPVSILELRELPSMLKTTGDTLIKKYAKRTLEREFGLVPLVSDYLKLKRFQEDADKKMLLFKQLREKPMVRKATLFRGGTSTFPGTSHRTNSAPSYCRVDHKLVSTITNTKIWGYVTWTPEPDFNRYNPIYSDEALSSRALNATLGTNIGLTTLWNALPWSWMVDWFGNIGDWLSAHRSIIPVNPSTPRICRTTTTTSHYTVLSSNIGLPIGGSPVEQTLVSKSRELASATLPSASLPLFTQRQADIIASLAILRMK